MQTRNVDYSNCDYVYKVFNSEMVKRIDKINLKSDGMSNIEKIYNMNSLFIFIKKNVDNLIKIKNVNNQFINNIEVLFKLIIKKKLEFEKDILYYIKKYEKKYNRDCNSRVSHIDSVFDGTSPSNSESQMRKFVLYKEVSIKFIKKVDSLNNIICDYYTRKYIAILLKTNRDIFRIVLSYIVEKELYKKK